MNRIILSLSTLLAPFFVLGHEGMWLPTVLESIQDDMQAMGLRLSAEDIYAINNSSIKDAVVLFGGGCTAEVISDQGLILTNHHCGFGAILSHTTVENDRMKNGFWALGLEDELFSAGVSATFVVRMEDVTEAMLSVRKQLKEGEDLTFQMDLRARQLADSAVQGTHYEAVVRPFNYENSYFLIVTEKFSDVRLVGTPPSAIGKFGGDTDNWMWPRHTGDFSLFRIYAGNDNKPAEYAEGNVPFRPRHALPLALYGAEPGDFAMIFG
ncbi:MAG: S46 family peptidase, partial [Flavobacteriales bacterium]|nr:S46 family peptidase [Flavobacteriales bacterium]